MFFRPGTPADLDAVEQVFTAVMDHEAATVQYSVFRKGVYPTRAMLAQALAAGEVELLQEGEVIPACLLYDRREPAEYQDLPWTPGPALVIHLLAVDPVWSGRGFGSALVRQILEKARQAGCVSVKLDTGGQNKPAQKLYGQKLGFRLVADRPMMVGGLIAHKEHFFYEHPV